MNAATANPHADQSNESGVILSDVFAAIRDNSDKQRNVTAELLEGLFQHEVSFDMPTLEYFFKADPAKRKSVRARILMANDDKYKEEVNFLEGEMNKDKKARNIIEMERVNARHKSIHNIFDACMWGCYFLRVGGDISGNVIGPVKTLKKVADRFIISYVDEDDTVTRLQGQFSARSINQAGEKVVKALLNKAPKENKSPRSVSTSPTSILNSSASTISVMLDQALNEQTAALKAKGTDVERATLDDMPDDVTTNLDNVLSKLIKAKFAHEGVIEAVDVIAWLSDTLKDVKIDMSKQVRPLKKTA